MSNILYSSLDYYECVWPIGSWIVLNAFPLLYSILYMLCKPFALSPMGAFGHSNTKPTVLFGTVLLACNS